MKLKCFTPLATLVTFAIEAFFALYVLIKFRKNLFTFLAVIFLLMLGSFQLSEYMTCTYGNAALWGKIGYLSITFLPAVGLHLISLISRKSKWQVPAYLYATVMAVWIAFVPGLIFDVSCTGKYLVFNTENTFDYFYAVYYIGFLSFGLAKLIHSWVVGVGKRNAVRWMTLAYLSFIVPMGILYVLVNSTKDAVPSIMCGFALTAAVILVFKVIPNYFKK